MDFDLVGVEAVCNVIRMSKLNKFVIHKYGAAQGSYPIFESLNNPSFNQAAEDFQRWANIVLSNNPDSTVQYTITVFEHDDGNAENFSTVGKQKRQNSKKIKTGFVLNNPIELRNRNHYNNHNQNQQQQPVNGTVPNGYISYQEMQDRIQATVKTTMAEMENKQLKERIKELEEDMDDDDDDDRDYFGEAWDLAKMKIVTGAAQKQEPSLSGHEQDGKTKGQKIIESIKIINTVVPDIDIVLMKLAKLAKENPATLQMYIQTFKNL